MNIYKKTHYKNMCDTCKTLQEAEDEKIKSQLKNHTALVCDYRSSLSFKHYNQKYPHTGYLK